MIKNVNVLLGDIMVQETESIVCFLSPDMEWEGSLNQKILAAAGDDFDTYVLDHVVDAKPGEVYAVPGFNLSFKTILLAINPVWEDALQQEDRELMRCYRGVIDCMIDEGVKTVSVPAMGKGQRRFPHARAARIAMRAFHDYMDPRIEEINMVCYDQTIFEIYKDRYDRY